MGTSRTFVGRLISRFPESQGPNPIPPCRMRGEKSEALSAAPATALMWACSFRTRDGTAPADRPCAYANAPALPFTPRRQFHGVVLSPAAALVWIRMLVVQLLVTAL